MQTSARFLLVVGLGLGLPVSAAGRDACQLLTSAEITEVTGLPVSRMERGTDGCQWFTDEAAREKQTDATRNATLKKMSQGEPKSFEESQQNVENVFKNLGMPVQARGPLVSLSVNWKNGAEAEQGIKGGMAAAGGGTPGGRLEPVAGLGDRAYFGPVGSFLYVRKGPALVSFDLRSFPGTRDQAVTLARKVVSKI
jgi:hypothetical protein